MFFAQHSLEKRVWTLWEGWFFIAWRGCSVNVTKRRRGGIPLLRCPGYGIAQVVRNGSG